jgi:hypothetical protein
MRRNSPRAAILCDILSRRACAYVNHIYHRVPVSRKLCHLPGIDVEQQSNFVRVLEWLSLHVRHVDAATRNRVQNPH